MLEDFDFNAPWMQDRMSHNNMWDPELNMSFALKEGKKEKKTSKTTNKWINREYMVNACEGSPPWGCSRPCRHDFWTHPSKPRPLSGRFAACEKSGPRCRACARALCERFERRAGPPRCRHTATPGSEHLRWKIPELVGVTSCRTSNDSLVWLKSFSSP